MINSVCDKIDVNAGLAGSESWSMVDAGIYSNACDGGAVPIMDFEEKLQLQ